MRLILVNLFIGFVGVSPLFGMPVFDESEPQFLLVYSGSSPESGQGNRMDFARVKEQNFKSINYYPMYKDIREFSYSGIDLRELLSEYKVELKPGLPVTFLGRSEEYIVQFKSDELIKGKAKIALSSPDSIPHKERGNQLIFADKFREKVPENLRRRYGMWWVRTMIIGSEPTPATVSTSIKLEPPKKYTASVIFPEPFGFSSIREPLHAKSLSLRELRLDPKSRFLQVETLNKKDIKIPIVNGHRYLLFGLDEKAVDYKFGGVRLFVVDEANGRIDQFLKTVNYVTKLSTRVLR